MVRVIGDREAGEVGDVLAQCLFTLHVEARQCFIGVVLRGELLAGGLEMREIGRRPPVGHASFGIEIGAEVVEAVADLVANHRADRTVIGGGIGLGIEERCFENCRREVQRVLQRQVHRVHGLRRHPPLAAIGRLAEFGGLVLVFGESGAFGIAQWIVGLDLQLRIIAPAVGIADADLDRRDLGFRLGLGVGAHPVELVNAFREHRQQVVDELGDLFLRGRREIFLRVALADGVAEHAIGHRDAALPAFALLGNAVEHGAVEGEGEIIERLGQEGGAAVDGMEGQPRFPGIDRLAAHQRGEFGDGLRLPGIDVLLAIEAGGLEVGAPVEARRLLGEIGGRPQVVGLVGVLAVGERCLRLGDLHFQRHDLLRLGIWIGDAGLLQQCADVGFVLAADLGHRLVVRQVIVAVGQAEAALQQIGNVLRRIGQALGHEQAEQVIGLEIGGIDRIDVGAQSGTEVLRQRGLVFEAGDRVEFRLQWRESALLDAGGVHVGVVGVGDARFITAGGRLGRGDALDQLLLALLGLVEHVEEGAGGGTIGRNLRGLGPGAIRVIVEVVAGLDRLVDAGQVDANRRRGRRRRLGRCVGIRGGCGGVGFAGGEGTKHGKREGGAAEGLRIHAGTFGEGPGDVALFSLTGMCRKSFHSGAFMQKGAGLCRRLQCPREAGGGRAIVAAPEVVDQWPDAFVAPSPVSARTSCAS